METLNIIKNVLNYIEDNIGEDSIDVKKIANIMHENKTSAERIFRFLTGYTIKEYFKNRKLSMAGMELLKKDKKIIDVAVMFGYSSSQAFTRAFKSFYGFSPSEIENKSLKLFAPLILTLSIGNEFLTYRYVELEEQEFYGVYCKTSNDENAGQAIRDFWKSFDKSKLIGDRYGFNIKESPTESKYYITSKTKFENSEKIKIRASKYAMFSFDRNARVEHKINDIINYWIGQSGLTFDSSIPIIERYTTDALEIYYPIKIKNPLMQ